MIYKIDIYLYILAYKQEHFKGGSNWMFIFMAYLIIFIILQIFFFITFDYTTSNLLPENPHT